MERILYLWRASACFNTGNRKKKVDYLDNLYKSVYLVDILERNKIRNRDDLDELVRIMASTVGSPANPTKLSNTFKSVKT